MNKFTVSLLVAGLICGTQAWGAATTVLTESEQIVHNAISNTVALQCIRAMRSPSKQKSSIFFEITHQNDMVLIKKMTSRVVPLIGTRLFTQTLGEISIPLDRFNQLDEAYRESRARDLITRIGLTEIRF